MHMGRGQIFKKNNFAIEYVGHCIKIFFCIPSESRYRLRGVILKKQYVGFLFVGILLH